MPYKNSGVDWCPTIPESWTTTNPKALFSLRNQRVSEGERQLTASQKLGIVYQDEFMEMENQKVVLFNSEESVVRDYVVKQLDDYFAQ